MKKLLATAALGAAAVAAGAGTANAAPSAAPSPAKPAPADFHTLSTQILPGVQYTSNTTDRSVHITSPLGSLTTQGGQFQLQDSQGKILYGAPFAGTPKATVDAPTAPSAAAIKPAAAPLTSVHEADHDRQADINTALGIVSTNFGLATGVGATVGGIAGLIGGCAVGGLIGAAISPEIFFTGGIPGCLAGIGIGGTVGPIIGGAIAGVPVGIATAIEQYNDLHAKGDI